LPTDQAVEEEVITPKMVQKPGSLSNFSLGTQGSFALASPGQLQLLQPPHTMDPFAVHLRPFSSQQPPLPARSIAGILLCLLPQTLTQPVVVRPGTRLITKGGASQLGCLICDEKLHLCPGPPLNHICRPESIGMVQVLLP
jgi:hypothetical protein